jgi:hypothetical protein
MESEMQPGVMRAQKREIQISHIKKKLIFFVKKISSRSYYMDFILKLVIKFMNRKSSCGYATHFYFLFTSPGHLSIQSRDFSISG